MDILIRRRWPARSAIAPTAALTLLAALLLIGGAHHEAWFDEAQAWLIARDTHPWTMLSHAVRYEGTPGLWHLTLWLVQKAGGGFSQIGLVSAGFALAGAALILFRAPFPMWLRIGLIFSYVFAYQFSVVARSYAWDLLLLPLLASLYSQRCFRPLVYAATLGLLANANAHSFLFAGALGLEFAWALRPKREDEGVCAVTPILARATALLLLASFLTFALFQAAPPHDVSFMPRSGLLLSLNRPYGLISEALIDRYDIWAGVAPSGLSHLIGMGLSLAILLPIVALAAAARRRFVFWSLFLAFFAFSAAQYGNLWHSGLLWLALVFVLWVSWDGRASLSPAQRLWLDGALGVWVAIHGVYAAAAWSHDWNQSYCGGPAAAQALQRHRQTHPQDRIAVLGVKAFSMEPWFSANPFDNYGRPGEARGYYLWSDANPLPPAPTPDAIRRQFAGATYDYVFLSPGEFAARAPALAAMKAQGYCRIRTFPGALFWKTYVYEPDDIDLFGRCTDKRAF